MFALKRGKNIIEASMTTRPVFIPGKTADAPFEEVSVNFRWHGGFAISQKLRNVDGLHAGFLAKFPGHKILEISTKSERPLGKALSAFNLKLDLPVDGIVALESAYQASKVFQKGGPFSDLMHKDAYAAKKDPRLQIHGDLVGFKYQGQEWPLSGSPSLYDWLYVTAVRNAGLIVKIAAFDAFTDIEFNPKKSHNCQARTAAICSFFFQKYEDEWFQKASDYCLSGRDTKILQGELF